MMYETSIVFKKSYIGLNPPNYEISGIKQTTQ